jgi:hypothetical protein
MIPSGRSNRVNYLPGRWNSQICCRRPEWLCFKHHCSHFVIQLREPPSQIRQAVIHFRASLRHCCCLVSFQHLVHFCIDGLELHGIAQHNQPLGHIKNNIWKKLLCSRFCPLNIPHSAPIRSFSYVYSKGSFRLLPVHHNSHIQTSISFAPIHDIQASVGQAGAT